MYFLCNQDVFSVTLSHDANRPIAWLQEVNTNAHANAHANARLGCQGYVSTWCTGLARDSRMLRVLDNSEQ